MKTSNLIASKKRGDIFDRLAEDYTDIFDRVELPVEDKVAFSDTLRDVLKELIDKKIAELPIGQMIGSVIEKQVTRALKENERTSSDAIAALERKMKDDAGWTKDDMKRELETMGKDLKKKYADLRNEILSASGSSYTFGGFPQFGSAQEGKFLKISSGTPTWATGGGGGSSLTGYTVNNPSSLKTFDVTDTSVDELARIVGQMITDLSV